MALEPTATAEALDRIVAYIDSLPPETPPGELRATLTYRRSSNSRRKGWFALIGLRDTGEDVGLHPDVATAVEAELAEEGVDSGLTDEDEPL